MNPEKEEKEGFYVRRRTVFDGKLYLWKMNEKPF